MKNLFTIIALFISTISFAQNVGIGETNPTESKLQVKTADSAGVLIQNSTTSGVNVKTGLFFKTGNYYSASIATIGSGATFRMGLFTYGGSNAASLLERLSILDGGNVGIGTITPTAKLEVNGSFKLTGGSPGAGKVLTSDADGLASWATPSGLTLPYTGSLAAPSGYLFNLTNTETTQGDGFITTINSINSGAAVAGVAANASPAGSLVAGVTASNFSTNANGVGLWAFHAGLGSAIYANTANGIGANISSTNGFALQTKGKLQFAGNGVGTLAAGKFLKSTDALGNAAWADLLPYSGIGSLANNLSNPALLNIQNTSATIGSGIKGITDAVNGGAGVIGFATATTITNPATYGVYGNVSSTSTSGAGVFGNHSGGGEGVYGNSFSGIGVYGDGSTGVKGEGAYGVHGIGSTYGVFGERNGTTGSAIHGVGGARGVYGQSQGYGVYGISLETNPTLRKQSGVYGESQSTTDLGSGVYGIHNGVGPGVRGFSINGIGGSFSSDNGYALLTQDGKVGIGTQTPAAKMDIAGSSNITHFYFGANEDTYIRGGKAGSNVLINDVNPGKVGVGLSNPNQFMDVNGRMRLYHTGAQTGGAAITSGIWLNNNVNGLGTADGAFVGINCSAAGSETVGIFIGGTWRFDVDRSGNGRFGGVVTASSGFACASDFRYKKNITPLHNALKNILQLNGVNYLWKQEEFPDKNFSANNQVGFIAQDLEKIYPEMVFTDDKGYKSVDYARLTPVLVEAVKELSVKNDNQQAQIDELKKELSAFKKLVNSCDVDPPFLHVDPPEKRAIIVRA